MSPETASVGKANCPTVEDLTAFREGRLAPDRWEAIRSHLAGCLRCELACGDPPADGSLPPWVESPSASHPARTTNPFGASSPDVRPDEPVPHADLPAAEEASRHHPAPLQLGYYEILDRIGRGGMGDVYRARHVLLKRTAALKILPVNRTASPQAVARFRREVELAGRIEHVNVVKAMDAGVAQGVHYLVMELVDGVDLAQLLKRRCFLPLAEASELARQAAIGLQAVHEHHLVHRDIKPSNLMLSCTGCVKILDLGLALLHGNGGQEELTASGQTMGTADYMAPEQWYDTHSVDIRADLYSLGCTLYKLLTGEAPFSSPEYDTSGKKMEAHARLPVPPIQNRRPDLPAEFIAVLDRLLAKKPADRFPVPLEAAAALAPFAAAANLPGLLDNLSSEPGDAPQRPLAVPLTPLPVPAPPPRLGSRIWRTIRSRTALLSLMVLATALLTGWKLLPFTAPSPNNPVEQRNNVEIGKWSVLLRRTPERLWPRTTAPDYFAHWDENGQSLRVHSGGTCLFALGEAAQPSHRIQVGLTQIPWNGRAGVFVGYHSIEGTNPPRFRCQLFELMKSRNGREFSIERKLLTIRESVPEGVLQVEDSGVSRSPIPHPAVGQEHILEIQVGRGRVHTVIWNGQLLPGLVEEKYDQRVKPEDQLGVFGSIVLTVTASFRMRG